MIEILHLLKELGSQALDLFWLPVAIWTGFALLTAGMFKLFSNLSTIYHYHFRIAVLAALPAGIILAPFIQALLQPAENGLAAVFFVIQNPMPLTVTPEATSGFNWFEPVLWTGIATAVVILLAVTALAKLLYNYVQLNTFVKKLEKEGSSTGLPHLQNVDPNIEVLFSDAIDIPCTFGLFKKRIVIPANLRKQPEKCSMALRHEITHIRNHDYLLNNLVQGVKALFWFHPLVHYFARQTSEYREIYCDLLVLTDNSISQKDYAQLLFELAPKPVFKNMAAVQMAVNSSTLKKRIQMMKKHVNFMPSLKQSIAVTILLGLTLTGFMACSDITTDGTTVAEIEEMQEKSQTAITLHGEKSPLFVLNDEILDSKDEIITRIKPKYIKSIEVLKGEAAIEAYGEKGKYGVVIIELLAKEKALKDLAPEDVNMDADINLSPSQTVNGDEIFVAVQEMPKLKGSRKELQQQLEYPESCREANIEGTVIVQFVVTKTGDLTNFEVIKGIGGGCDEAAVAAIKNYAEFTPGEQKGKKVDVRMSFPVVFSMQ